MTAIPNNPQQFPPGYVPMPAGPGGPGYPQYVMVPMRQSNGLGVFGFLIALIGLFIPTGIVALLGLLISLVALGRSPRGFAFMGLLVGLIGTIVWLVIDLAALVFGLLLLAGTAIGMSAAFVMTQPEVVEITSDMMNAAIAVEHHHKTTDQMPENLDGLGLSIAALTDPWGTRYEYRLLDKDEINGRDELTFEVTSAGPDAEFGTEDDVMLSKIDRLWEQAFDTFGEKMEQFGEKMEALEGNHYSYGDNNNCIFSSSRCDDAVAERTISRDAPAAAESYADGYERRAAKMLEQRNAPSAVVVPTPTAVPDVPAEPLEEPADVEAPAPSGAGPAR